MTAIDPNAEPLISITEATKGTPYTSEYLSLLAPTRRIPARKIGRKWMVTRSDVQQYAERRKDRERSEASNTSDSESLNR